MISHTMRGHTSYLHHFSISSDAHQGGGLNIHYKHLKVTTTIFKIKRVRKLKLSEMYR